MRAVTFTLLVLAVACSTQTPVSTSPVNFPATGLAAAHAEFIKGATALHNSGYEAAAEYFQNAERLDPNFVMAYWGEAMSFNHPFVAGQDIGAGRRALAKLAPSRAARAAKAQTARERDYLNAVELLYGEGDKDERDSAFATAMQKVAADYPDDIEASLFYAAALIGTLRSNDHSFSIQSRAGAIVKPILDKHPDHPGALHYYIHANDDPAHAQAALDAARKYERVAGDSWHALHMPSHIYMQLGMWQDAERANQAALDASERFIRSKGISVDKRDNHSLDWLAYAELQLGKYRDARKHEEMMFQAFEEARVPGMQTVAAIFASRFAVETGQWDAIDRYPQGTTVPELLFAQGMAAVSREALPAVKQIAATLGELGQRPGRLPAWVVTSFAQELQAQIALAEKGFKEAQQFAAQAAELESKSEFPSGPPDLLKPACELYGEVLLAANKPGDAAGQFQYCLQRMPKRALSLLGLGRALSASGDAAGAVKAFDELRSIWAAADAEVRGLLPQNVK